MTVIVKGKLIPGVAGAGVPVISPVFAFKLSPVASEPEETLQVRVPVPPVAVSIWS